MQPKINFLPYRDIQKQDIKVRFKNIMIGTAFLGIFSVLLGGYIFEKNIQYQQERNSFLQNEIKKLDEQLVEVSNLKNAIAALEIQRDTVYVLQNNRTHAVELMEMFTRRAPEEVYLSEAAQNATKFNIKGMANTNERVSQLMKSLEQVQWIKKVNLLQTKAIKIDEISPITGIKTPRVIYEFSISFERFIEDNVNPSIAPVKKNNAAAAQI